MKRPPRVPSHLPESLHKRLNAYALAASAAGVGTLIPSAHCLFPLGAALTSVFLLSADLEAKIVYTPANLAIQCTSTAKSVLFPLTLNNGSTTDFDLVCYMGSGDGGFVKVKPVGGENKIWNFSTDDGHQAWASALRAGAVLKPSKRFLGETQDMVVWNVVEGQTYSYGPWANVTDRYLGLRFIVNGKAHFGWARLSTSRRNVKLTGYAYETIPNKPIIAGKTHGEDNGTLGRLAQGASGR